MTRRFVTLLTAIPTTLAIIGCSPVEIDSSGEQLVDQSDVGLFESQFHQDKRRCEQCFDAERYFASAGHGLNHFRSTERVFDAASFEELIISEWEFYEKFFSEPLDYVSLEPEIARVYDRFERIYPNERRPKVYFTVGQTFSGGTASERGIIVAVETFGFRPRSTSYGRPVINRALLVPLIAHELVHFHQRIPEAEELRLIDIIAEGSADYIAELLVGPVVRDINSPELYSYGFENTVAIAQKLSDDLDDGDLEGWLYSNDTPFRRDIGYFAGYCIAKLYVEHSEDQSVAIKDLIELKRPEDILQKSGFLTDGQCDKAAAAL